MVLERRGVAARSEVTMAPADRVVDEFYSIADLNKADLR
jgi:hypothetical protein